MGLVARAIESRGIPTITLAALRMPSQLSRPPRLFFTGYKNHEIVGPPNDREAQLATLRRALQVLAEATEPGTLVERPTL